MDTVQTMATESVEARLERLARLRAQENEIAARFAADGSALNAELDARLDALMAAVQPQIDALLATIAPQIDAVRAEYAPRMIALEEAAQRDAAPITAELQAVKTVAEAQVRALGRTVKINGLQAVYYKGKVSMNTDRVLGFLQAQAAVIPDFKPDDYYTVGAPYVQWRGL